MKAPEGPAASPLHADPSLPKPHLLSEQAEWLSAARSRMLRRIGIAQQRSILDLGAGYGSVSAELMRRSTGYVTAFDRSQLSLYETPDSARLFRIVGGAPRLPFAQASFDVVFCQVGLLWMKPLSKVIEEVSRVLQKGGVFLSIEPDYDSMIEYPAEVSTQDLWIKTLLHAGGDPYAGRKSPAILESLGFRVRIDMIERIHPPSPSRFDFLRELPLTGTEKEQLDLVERRSEQLSGWSQIVHLPFILITAEKR